MGVVRIAGAVLALSAWVSATATAGVADIEVPPGLDDQAEATLFMDIGPPWRDYFLQARRAEREPDALQRCLASPDFPDTAWPDGYSEMHCHYHFGDSVFPDEIKAHLDRGDIAGLEARVETLMARHDTSGPERESGHRFFHLLTGSDPVIGPATERWVEMAPHSALAATARATYLRGEGARARGGRFVKRTLPGQLHAMSRWFDQAEAEYRRAIGLRPGLLDAYIGLMNIGKFDRSIVEEEAFAKARDLDPGCAEVAYTRMTALLPRWGGSYPQMEAYWDELAPHLSTTPMLANQQSERYADYVSSMDRELRLQREAAGILELGLRMSGNEDVLHAAAANTLHSDGGSPDRTRAAALLLQESRFRSQSAWGSRHIANFLGRYAPRWALQFAHAAAEEEPGNAWGRYLLAAANYNSGRFTEAERQYLVAARDEVQRPFALRELSAMWLFDAGLSPRDGATRARPHIDQLRELYPDDGQGLLLDIYATAAKKGQVPQELVDRFLEVADLDDPVQAAEYTKFSATRTPVQNADNAPE